MNKDQQYYYDELVQIAAKNKWEVISEKYEKSRVDMLFKCPEGHVRNIIPSNFKRKKGPKCAECLGKCPIAAERNFRARIKELGGEVVGEYINTNTSVKCICANKHECAPHPYSVVAGRGMCIKCAGQCPEDAKIRFIDVIKKIWRESYRRIYQ